MYLYIIIILVIVFYFYNKRENMSCDISIREPPLANPYIPEYFEKLGPKYKEDLDNYFRKIIKCIQK